MRWLLLVGFFAVIALNVLAQPYAPRPAPKTGGKADVGPDVRPKAAPRDADQWLTSLTDGYAEAQRLRQPIFVRVGGDSCPWCRKLEVEIRKPEMREELSRWSLVVLDADKAGEEIKPLSVSGIPALRLLTPMGRVVASHDGFMPADELLTWLKKNFAAASAVPPEELTGSGAPSQEAVTKLVALFKDRDPALREAAVRRLLPHPSPAAPAVAEMFATGPLQARLAALELLSEWNAPVEGVDPWRPETVTPEKLAAIKSWSAKPPESIAPKPLSTETLTSARLDLDRLGIVADVEAAAIRERLARHGQALMPEVYARLKSPPSDQARERLTALRYRLVANDALALNWPGGLERLASDDPRFRHAAIQELARRANANDEALLLELFSSPDALVRELSLRILHASAGRQATNALVKLLQDPEPNVRAAVLKQLADQPSPAMVKKLSEYIEGETDADLVVHAVRAVRAAESEESLNALKPLLKHDSWRVRAEAAQSIGEAVTNYRRNVAEREKAAAYAALIEALNDADGFVVSRSISALKKADRRDAVDPLAKLVDRAEPLLAAQAVKALNTGGNTRESAMPHIRKFCGHAQPEVRAAAIKELCSALGANGVETELRAALKDSASTVRTAGAEALFALLNSQRGGGSDEDDAIRMLESGAFPVPQPPVPPPPEMSGGGFLDGILDLFSRPSRPPQPMPSTPTGVPVQSTPPPVTTPPPQPAPPPAPPTERPPPMQHVFGFGQQPAPQPPQPVQPRPAFDSLLPAFGRAAEAEAAVLESRNASARPSWMANLPETLEPMLSASSAEERLAAALALIAMGKDERALPIALEVANKNRGLRGKAGDALPWLTWAKREDTYQKLIALNPDPEQLEQIVRGLTSHRDRRVLPLLWTFAAREGLTNDLIELTISKLQYSYFGNDLNTYTNGARRLKPEDVKKALDEARPKTESGPELQRLIALVVMISADRSAARAAAEKIIADEKSSDRLKRDAAQVRLYTIKPPDRRSAAIDWLSHPLPGIRGVAVQFLALENEARLAYIADRGIKLDSGGSEYLNRMPGAPINTNSPNSSAHPKDIKIELLRPFVRESDAASAAAAGSLLTRLGEADGFEALYRYWREYAPKDEAWARMVLRAAAALGDDSRVPAIEEIYVHAPSIGIDPSEVQTIIKDMKGPAARRLLKQIRHEHGGNPVRP